ncbi:MAG: HU family DNA-binding protein [Spirochaetota bacterium]|jgi:DNA-binding protein HU-beta|nr:HU family DNA-binding protein [Spirochaetota bacterium]
MSAAGKPLTKTEILTELAGGNDMSKAQVSAFLDSLCAIAYREAKKNAKFTLPGFGILKLQKRAARMGRNPATGESIKIPAKTVVKFVLSKACKEAILAKKK